MDFIERMLIYEEVWFFEKVATSSLNGTKIKVEESIWAMIKPTTISGVIKNTCFVFYIKNFISPITQQVQHIFGELNKLHFIIENLTNLVYNEIIVKTLTNKIIGAREKKNYIKNGQTYKQNTEQKHQIKISLKLCNPIPHDKIQLPHIQSFYNIAFFIIFQQNL